MTTSLRVAAVLPWHRVSRHILGLLSRIGLEIERVFVVGDACLEGTGALVGRECRDQRVVVLVHPRNRGVGGAVKTGYVRALSDGFDSVVKIDGDGQMPPKLVPAFIECLRRGSADHVKENRLFNPEDVRTMPAVQLFGNTALSFMTNFSSRYWRGFEPTNGLTAIHRAALPAILGVQLLLAFLPADIVGEPTAPLQAMTPPSRTGC